MSKKLILRCLLEEQDMSVMLRARLMVTIANPASPFYTLYSDRICSFFR